MGTRHAFHRLLADAVNEHRWTLIAEQEKKVGGKIIRPDGTFKDEMNLVRGYWEAKDTADKLEAEIEKKRKAGYPPVAFVNIGIRLFKPHQVSLFSGDRNGSLPPRNTIVSSSLDIVATHGVRNTQTQRQLALRGSSRRSITC
jgi:hypothetical protein